jgi:SAM-dependent methyltransferase
VCSGRRCAADAAAVPMKVGRLSRWYRWIEYAAFGLALERQRFAFLPRLASARCILILGEGDGRSLSRLLALAPLAVFDVVEISPEMIALARQRTGNSARVTFFWQDARTVNWPPVQYDGIVTHFFLDCFAEGDVRQLIRRLKKTLTPDGIWLMSEFAIPDKGWRRLHAWIWIAIMYRFFGVTTGLTARALPPIERLMREAGMARSDQEKARAGLMVSEVWRRASKPSGAPRTSP